MNDGWAKFHRKIIDWEWYTDPNAFRVFFHLVLMANHKDKRWQGVEIKRGQLVTSSESLQKQLKLSRQQIRTSLNKLISTNEITIKSTNRFTLVTVANYESYQKRDEESTNGTTNESTINQPTSNQRITTNKNYKKDKNDNKENKLVRFDEFWSIYPKKQSKSTAISSFSKVEENEIDLIIEDVKAKSKTVDWTKEGGKYIPMPSTYLNQRRWEDSISIPKPVERKKEDQFLLAADRCKGIPVEYNPFNRGDK